MSCKALGIALKLTFEGDNQLAYPQTYIFMMVVAAAVVTQVRGGLEACSALCPAGVLPVNTARAALPPTTHSRFCFPAPSLAPPPLARR